jgi:hypothetical protein
MAKERKVVREPPTIELYMYSLNQEFPVGRGHETYLKRFSELQEDVSRSLVERNQVEEQAYLTKAGVEPVAVPADWSVKWLSNRWVTNHTKAVGVGRRPELDPLRTAILRREDFGAIVFEPRTDRVYKLNKTGAEMFERLQALHREGDGTIKITEKNRGDFAAADFDAFVKQLRAVGLWSPHAA